MHAPTAPRPPASGRLDFLDACRALAVLGMLLANMLNVFVHRVPEALAHNEGDVLRLLDFPAAVFQFLIGVSLVLFLERRTARGLTARGARRTALRRFALLVALGVLLDGVGALAAAPRWGVLQTLGLGGAIGTALADAPDGAVAAVAVAVLGLYSGAANGEVHHSPLAAVAFLPLTLAGLLVGRGLRGPSHPGFVPRATAVTLGGLALAALAHAGGVPFNKVLGSSSFVALAVAVAALLLLATATLALSGGRFPAWLLAVGSNALMAWVLQYVLVYYPAWLVFPDWERLALVPGIAATLATIAALCVLTVALGRRGIRIPI